MQLRDKLQAELRILMHVLPLSQKESVEAVQRVNIDPSPENMKNLMDAGSKHRAYVELVSFICRMLDE